MRKNRYSFKRVVRGSGDDYCPHGRRYWDCHECKGEVT